MKAPITSAQAMSHPTVVETINTLGEIAAELREALATARADEREECAKMCDEARAARLAEQIRARGTT
jgi:hypothetical protein